MMQSQTFRALIRSTGDMRALAATAVAAALFAAAWPAPAVAAAQASTQASTQLAESERRFREVAAYVRARGELDEQSRTDLVRAAAALDADLARDALARPEAVRLLTARAQAAVLLEDRASMESAFARLADLAGRSEAILLAWARERLAFADFAGAHALLASRGFETSRAVDAAIARAEALVGLDRFEDAQALLNRAPAQRTPQQMSAIVELSKRIGALKDLWNAELVAIARDQSRDDLPLVELLTTKGPIVLELFEDQAYNTVGNFVEHVERGTYDGTRFHRALRGFGVQGGDPETASSGRGGTGSGGWTIPDEPAGAGRRATLLGRVLMASQPLDQTAARPRPNSAGCQFMILLSHAETLAGDYAPFGRVADGMDTVRELGPDDSIVSARMLRKRDRTYEGVRLSVEATGDFSMPRKPGTATRALETRIGPAAPPQPQPAPQPQVPPQVIPFDPEDISPRPIPRNPSP